MINGRQASDASQEIDVILHEYDSLRAEIISRANSRFQLIGYLGIAATLLGTSIGDWERWILIGVSLAGFMGVWVVFGLYIKKCANRLREIEHYIKGKVGPGLLVWETRLEGGSRL